jgi:hypothetical protein
VYPLITSSADHFADKTSTGLKSGFPDSTTTPSSKLQDAQPDVSAPAFRPVPNRWLVTRHSAVPKLGDSVGRKGMLFSGVLGIAAIGSQKEKEKEKEKKAHKT